MRMRQGLSLGRNFRITSPAGAICCSSCSATTSNPSVPESWKAISPHGVFLFGVPSSPPRPRRESNSVPTNTAVAVSGTDVTPAWLRIWETPVHLEDFGPLLAR